MTATPWRTDGTHVMGPSGHGEHVVAVCRQAKPRNTNEALANAERIVRAVNCHEELLAACKAAIHYAETCRDMPEFSSGYCVATDLFEAIKTAVAKAEGRAK